MIEIDYGPVMAEARYACRWNTHGAELHETEPCEACERVEAKLQQLAALAYAMGRRVQCLCRQAAEYGGCDHQKAVEEARREYEGHLKP